MSRVSRIGARRAKTGKRQSSGNFSSSNLVSKLTWEMGETVRLVFPYFTDENGDKYVLRYGEPFHGITKKGFTKLTSKQGKKYTVFNARCSHVYSQISREDQVKIAEKKQECAFCNLAKYENRRRLAEMEKQFGKGGFKDLPENEKKAFFKEFNDIETVQPSYYKVTDEDGTSTNIPRIDTYTLALQLQMEEFEEVNARGKTVHRLKPKINEETGVAEYKPVLVPMSINREKALISAVESAIEQEVLEESDLHIFNEGEGDNAEEVVYAFVDIAFDFPVVNTTKAQSGQQMTMVVQKPSKSNVVTPEFIEHVESQKDILIKNSETGFKATNKQLELISFDEQLNMMEDGGELYHQLEAEYKITEKNVQEGYKTDDEIYEEQFERVLGTYEEDKAHEDSESIKESEKEVEKEPKKGAKKEVKEPKKEVKTEVKETKKADDVKTEISDTELDEFADFEDLDDL